MADVYTGNLTVGRRDRGDAIVLSVDGVVDEVTTPSLATHLDIAMIDQPRVLIVDLSSVRFLSSSGINLLVEVQRLAAAASTAVRIAAHGHATSRPMRLLGIDRIVDLYSSADEALAAG